MRKILAIPVFLLGAFLAVRFATAVLYYPPVLVGVLFFPLSILAGYPLAATLILWLHTLGIYWSVKGGLYLWADELE